MALAVPALLGSVACAASIAGNPSDAPMLEKVVAISRHGVRSPTQSPQALNTAQNAPPERRWPDWPVAPGILTDHGADALSMMGGYLRSVYAYDGLLPGQGCPAVGAVQIWADGGDQRTRRSGQVLAEALAPSCALEARHGPEGQADPIFNAVGAGICPVDADAGLKALQAETDGGAGIVRPAETRALAALQRIVAPTGCGPAGGLCLSGPTSFAVGKKGVKLAGPLGAGASLAENLMLEYAQGMPLDQVGWGSAGSPAAIAAIMPVHERSAYLLRGTPYLASHNGVVMARTFLDLLQGATPSSANAPPLSPNARLLVLAGHDTNLSNMAGIFGLSWTLPGQPDVTAPDTVLAFELWRIGGVQTVRAVVYSQSLNQLRSADPLDAAHPAGVTPVAIPGCTDRQGVCRLSTLVALITPRLPAACLDRSTP